MTLAVAFSGVARSSVRTSCGANVMSIEKLNRAARAAGCAMAPPAELFDEAAPPQATGGWQAAKHTAKPQTNEPAPRAAWLRDMFTGWTSKATA